MYAKGRGISQYKTIYLRRAPSYFHLPAPIADWSNDANGHSSLQPLCNGAGNRVKISRRNSNLSRKSVMRAALIQIYIDLLVKPLGRCRRVRYEHRLLPFLDLLGMYIFCDLGDRLAYLVRLALPKFVADHVH